MTRVLSGEDVSAVARELGIGRTALQNWLAASKGAVTAVMTGATSLREDLAVYLHESLVTMTKHVRLYGSDDWIGKQKAETVLEATRTVGSRFVAVMDRLDGRPGEGGDSD